MKKRDEPGQSYYDRLAQREEEMAPLLMWLAYISVIAIVLGWLGDQWGVWPYMTQWLKECKWN